MASDREPLLPKHGGYRNLKSFQLAQIVYDLTVRFCNRYIDRRSRTHDQMVQAARAGVQNIAEGSQASATSKKTELKLTGVARASLEELGLDYEDYLRHRKLPLWARNDWRRDELIRRRCPSADAVADWIKELHDREHNRPAPENIPSEESVRSTEPIESTQPSEPTPSLQSTLPADPSVSTESTTSTQSTPSTKASPPPTYPEIAANAALALIAVTTALLDRQMASQATAFEQHGGFTERLYRVRSAERKRTR